MYKLTVKYRSGRRHQEEYENKHDLISTVKIVQDFCFVDAWTIEKDGVGIRGYRKGGGWKRENIKK